MARSRKDTARKDALVDRVRKILARRAGVTERRMFGGNCFMVNGNMIGGVTGDGELIIRVGPERYEQALEQPHAHEMKFTGRPMRGFVVIDAEGCEVDEDLRSWIEQGTIFARSLPAKKAK